MATHFSRRKNILTKQGISYVYMDNIRDHYLIFKLIKITEHKLIFQIKKMCLYISIVQLRRYLLHTHVLTLFLFQVHSLNNFKLTKLLSTTIWLKDYYQI